MARENLIKARLSMELEQADVAEALGVTHETVGRWERGVVTPYPIHVKALCALFGKNAQELDLVARRRPRYQLILARKSVGLSQETVAEAAKISRGTLGALERGKSNPREDTTELLCAFFKKSPQELDLDVMVPVGEQLHEEPVQHVTPQVEPASLQQHPEQQTDSLFYLIDRHVMTMRPHRWYHGKQSSFSLVPYLRQRSYLQPRSNLVAPVNDITGLSLPIMTTRRQAMHEMANSATAILFFSPYALLPPESREQLALAQIRSSYLDDTALNNLSSVTASYWRMLEHAPLDTLVGATSRHFETIVQFLKDTHSAPIYKRLCALASENAQLLGRIFHFINESDLSSKYYTFATKLALDIGHTDLWAVGIGRIALLQLYWGDPSDGLSLLQAAQHKTIHDTRLRAYLSAIEAEIYAEMGESDTCTRLLDQSKSVELPATLENDIYWTGFDPSLRYGYEGACYVRLHKPDKALDPLQQSLALLNPTFQHHQGSVRTIDIARVHAQLADPKEACKLLGVVLDTITQTRAVIDLQRVHKARAALKPWKNSAEVQKLDYQLRSAVNALKL